MSMSSSLFAHTLRLNVVLHSHPDPSHAMPAKSSLATQRRKTRSQPLAGKDSQPLAAKDSQSLTAKPSEAWLKKVCKTLDAFISKYGGQPAESSRLGKQVSKAKAQAKDLFADKLKDVPVLAAPSVKRANQFLKAVRLGQSLTPFKHWSEYMRHRVHIQDSYLSQMLSQLVCERGGTAVKRSIMPQNSRRRQKVNSQYDQTVSKKGGLAVVGATASSSVRTEAAVGADAALNRQSRVSEASAVAVHQGIPLTPQFVVDWLYQAVLDTVRVLESLLGDASYNAAGCAQGSGSGEVVLFWGSHLGSLREQGLIAWDYDADLAVFYHGNDFETTWNFAKVQLSRLGYTCIKHSKQKFRVTPAKPAAWSPYKELLHETREQNQGLNRATLNQKAASRWRRGIRAKQPHGSNCVDIEIYQVSQNSDLKLLGSQTIQASCADIFPTAVGVFGPLRFAIPRTPSMLFAEYGRDCLQQSRVKLLPGKTFADVPSCVRRVAWPACSLSKAASYLS